MNKIFTYNLPTEIIYGLGSSKHVGKRTYEFGPNALIVTDAGVVNAGIAEQIENNLKQSGVSVSRFDGVKPNPDVDTVDRAFELANFANVQVLIGLGGGSSLDVAKAVGVMLANGGRSIKEYFAERKVEKPILPLIAIPTTCGTGSEVTTSTVILDPVRKHKISVRNSTLLCAKLAIIDPLLMITLPPQVVATTGMDALTHAIEAYTSLAGFPITDASALYAIELIGKFIRQAASNPGNLEAIGAVSVASTIAGMSFGQASTTLVHCMSHALGGHLNVPHGLANAVLLPYVMDFNVPANPEKFARIALALGEEIGGLTTIKAAKQSVQSVKELINDLGIPRTLKDIGVKQDDIVPMSKAAAAEKRLANNCRIAGENDIKNIFLKAMTGGDGENY